MVEECHLWDYQLSYINDNFKDVVVAPFLLTAGTDARRFTDIADNIFRFAPIDLNNEQFKSIHGDNECININNIEECVRFYKEYIIINDRIMEEVWVE